MQAMSRAITYGYVIPSMERPISPTPTLPSQSAWACSKRASRSLQQSWSLQVLAPCAIVGVVYSCRTHTFAPQLEPVQTTWCRELVCVIGPCTTDPTS